MWFKAAQPSNLDCHRGKAGAGYLRCAGRRHWECPPDPRPGNSAARSWGLGPPAACTRRRFAHAGRLPSILSTVVRTSRAQRFSSTAVYPPCPPTPHEPSPRPRIRARRCEWSNYALACRFRAAAMGVPFLPLRSMLGTDTLARSAAKVIACPFTGRPLAAVPAQNHERITLCRGVAHAKDRACAHERKGKP